MMKVAIAGLAVLFAGAAFACPGDKVADKGARSAPSSVKESSHKAVDAAKAAKRSQTVAQVTTPSQTAAR